MEGRAKIIAPSLLYDEVGNILLFGRSRPPIDEAIEALTDLFALSLEVVSPTLLSAHATLRLASTHRLSYYDATYVALAEMLDCSLITADSRLAQRAQATGRVRLLAASTR